MKYLMLALVLASCVATTANGALTFGADAFAYKVSPGNTAAATKPAGKPAEKPAALANSTPEPAATPGKTGEAAPTDKPMSAWRRAYIGKHHHEPPVKAK